MSGTDGTANGHSTDVRPFPDLPAVMGIGTDVKVIDEPRAIVLVEEAERSLAEAITLRDHIEGRARSEALRHCIRLRGLSLSLQNRATRCRLIHDREIGRLLIDNPPSRGGRPRRNQTVGEFGFSYTLAEIGIEDNQSTKCQRLARIPDDVFESCIDDILAKQEELTTARLLRLACPIEEPDESPPDAGWSLLRSTNLIRDAVNRVLEDCPPDKVPVIGNMLRALGEEILERGRLRR